MKKPGVTRLLQAFGEQALPVTLVNGTILTDGMYPSHEEVRAVLASQRLLSQVVYKYTREGQIISTLRSPAYQRRKRRSIKS